MDLCADVGSVGYGMATPDDLAETAHLVEAHGRRMIATRADVRDSAAMTAAVDDGVRQLGRLDVVLANAGVASFAPAEEMSDAMWDDMIDINLSGVFRTVRPAIPHLKANPDGGAIVLTSSTGGMKGLANIAHYCAAKHGLAGLMKSLAIELAPHRIRVNVVAPTNVDTRMIQNASTYALFFPDRDFADVTPEEAAPAFATLNLLDVGWVDPSDVTEAVLYLVADSGRFVTGVELPVDAGMLAR